MRRDDRGACLGRRSHRVRDALVDRDELSEADRHGVRRDERLRVVEGQLEARDDEEPVGPPGTRGLALDLGEIERVGRCLDRAEAQAFLESPRIVRAHNVIRDAEDVEVTSPVEVDELCDRELAVAPARMPVELAQKGGRGFFSWLQRECQRWRRGEKSG
jgi:hypothetical protein